MKNVREVALQLLLRVEKSGSFSHLLIHQTIEQGKVNEKDEQLLTEIVYGTIERKLTLDYFLQPFIQKQKKLQDWVLILLRMSVFQMEFLQNIPSYAIINEAVEIAKQRGHKGIAKVVNGVLRSIQRQGVPSLEDIEDETERLAIATSHPTWLVQYWVDTYGYQITKEMCEQNSIRKPMTIRVNQLKTTRDEIISRLQSYDIIATPSPYVQDGLIIEKGNVLKTNLIKEGYITIQDHTSMLAAALLQAEEGMKVLDTCSAPGGKMTYIGEIMHNKGQIYAYDLHKNKTKLMENNTTRLGINNVRIDARDARTLQEVHDQETFDRIIVDAPCTGLGVLRSKADIKYNKQASDMYALQKVQLEILTEIAPLLKKDGKLLYSTCTVNKIENEAVVKAFIEQNPSYQVDDCFLQTCKEQFGETVDLTKEGMQIFPQTLNADGFFITKFIKKA